jgi:hypothetical protein
LKTAVPNRQAGKAIKDENSIIASIPPTIVARIPDHVAGHGVLNGGGAK